MTADAMFPSASMFVPADSELAAAIEELHQAQHRLECELRASIRRMSALACTCAKYFDWEKRDPPQLGCIVHGALMMDHEGRVL